jgi:hypothetical protein
MLRKVYTKRQFLYTFCFYIYIKRKNKEDKKMSFCISQLTALNLKEQQSDLEYELQLVTNSLMQLSYKSQEIVERQHREGQAYMSQHVDTDGVVDASAIEYVNSAVFNAKFEAQLKAIQVKEQTYNLQKQQIETKQKMCTTQFDGWIKNRDKGISDTFKYFQ